LLSGRKKPQQKELFYRIQILKKEKVKIPKDSGFNLEEELASGDDWIN